MSGFTTTGSTLLSDIEAQTPSILFWRSMTHWLGGIGIVVLFVAVAPRLGTGAARLLGAEVSGLTQPRLTPRIADTAKVLVVIYLAISVTETVALLAVGMPLYDAVINTFGTVATGGFSHKTASIGFYDSLAVEAIIIFFMTASGVSFSLYYLLYTRRRLDVLLDRELLAYLGIIVAAVFSIWGVLIFEGTYGDSAGQALRDPAFTVSSIITTTGFITADFDRWDTGAKITLVLLMFVGGCAGSTAGGHKGYPDSDRLPHDSARRLQDGTPAGRHPPTDRRTRRARRDQDRRARALRRLDPDLQPCVLSGGPPRGTHPDLLDHGGGDHAQRRGTGSRAGGSHRELRDRQPLRSGGAHGMHAAWEARDLYRARFTLAGLLEEVKSIGFFPNFREFTFRDCPKRGLSKAPKVDSDVMRRTKRAEESIHGGP
jgi:hypothetical protein